MKVTARRHRSIRVPGYGGRGVRLERWRAAAATNFVQAYQNAAAGLVSLPKSQGEITSLLNFFVLEKALYEIAYELANRPDWVEIPLAGAISLIGHQEPS